MPKAFLTFETALCTELKKKIEFCGKTFEPDQAKAIFEAVLCHTLPGGNLNGRGFTAKTMAKSYKSAQNQLCDFNHRLQFYGNSESDTVCGTIAAIDFPDLDAAVELSSKGTPVPLRGVLVAYRKAAGVEKMLAECASGKKRWRTSVEVEYIVNESALYDTVTNTFYPWPECNDEMKALVKEESVGNYKGNKMLFIPGGEDGEVLISGCAFTCWPADPKADLEQMAACHTPTKEDTIRVNAGWRNGEEYRQAVASLTSLTISNAKFDKFKSEHFSSNPIIGYTDPDADDGHKHGITKNLMILPANGHSHYMGMMSVENEPDGMHVCGVTSTYEKYMGDGRYTGTHCHTFDLGSMGSSTMGGVEHGMEVSSMDMKARIKMLRDSAQAVATSNPNEHKRLTDLANEFEKDDAKEGVEQVIAARITNGDLVTKEAHVTAVEKAKTDGEGKVRNEIAEAKKLEEQKATTLATRMQKVADAKLDPKFALGKDRTIASVVASIAVGPDGDKAMEERLEEWITIAASTGQMKASTGTGESVRPPVASTNSEGGGGKRNSLGLA